MTGIGQSLATTSAAVASLSNAGIAVVASNVTADNFNLSPDSGGKSSRKFFRVAPTNTEEAIAAVNYIKQHGYHEVLLVNDLNDGDIYTKTLANDFRINARKINVTADNSEPYRSPSEMLNVATRKQNMIKIFAGMHSDICAIKPDLIYFAGRGTDLGYFLTALSSSGACGFSGPLDVMTGDDASNLVGGPVSMFGDLSFTVFYTALAHTDEWSGFPSGSDYVKNYQDFATAFRGENFKDGNLDDGQAMVAHDAVLVAVVAVQQDPSATTSPGIVDEHLAEIHCENSVAGASGPIAFDSDGDPIDKAMPIVQLHSDGGVTQKELVWPTGQQFDLTSACGDNLEPRISQ